MLIQRFNAVLLNDSFVDDEAETGIPALKFFVIDLILSSLGIILTEGKKNNKNNNNNKHIYTINGNDQYFNVQLINAS